MKKLSKLILMIATGAIIFSCSSTKYELIHKPLILLEQCIFEKLTEEEKDSVTNDIGSKIYRNQKNCEIRQERIESNVKSHNEAHKP